MERLSIKRGQNRNQNFESFSFPIKREAKFTEHGLVLERSDGFYAVKFVGFENLKQTQQWLQMNLATNLDEWLKSFETQAIPYKFCLCR